jgi:hypothetical protein
MGRVIVVSALLLLLSACSLGGTDSKPKAKAAPPVTLVGASCEQALVALDAAAAKTTEPLAAKREEVSKLRKEFGPSLRRLKKAAGVLKDAAGPFQAFNKAHPETYLPQSLYNEWVALRDRYNAAFAAYKKRAAAARPYKRAYNQAVKEARDLWKDVGRSAETYGDKLEGCLGPTQQIIRSEKGRIARLEAFLSDISGDAAGRPVTLHCETASEWAVAEAGTHREGHLLGYVFRGARAVHLAPELCYTLHRLRFVGWEPDLSCITRSRDADVPLCAPRESELIRSAVTIAHEALHVAGEDNEKRAQCFGLQRAPLVAQQLGVPPSTGDQLAWYAWRFSEAPKSYDSPECRDGGKLDENPDSTSFP